jgi:hypothetical protein
MADVDAYVWHDQHGNITAVGRPVSNSKRVEPLAHGSRRVVKLSVAQEHLRSLHLTHTVDVRSGKLLARGPTPPSGSAAR